MTKPSRVKRAPPWLNSAGESGNIFHLELSVDAETRLLAKNSNIDGHSVNSLSLGAGSEDTGYSSDQDLNNTMGSDHPASVSHKRDNSKRKVNKSDQDRSLHKKHPLTNEQSLHNSKNTNLNSKKISDGDIDYCSLDSKFHKESNNSFELDVLSIDSLLSNGHDTSIRSTDLKSHPSDSSILGFHGEDDFIDDGVSSLNGLDPRTASFNNSTDSYSCPKKEIDFRTTLSNHHTSLRSSSHSHCRSQSQLPPTTQPHSHHQHHCHSNNDNSHFSYSAKSAALAKHMTRIQEWKSVQLELYIEPTDNVKSKSRSSSRSKRNNKAMQLCSLCEDILGIVPVRSQSFIDLEDDSADAITYDIYVKAVVPGSPASQNPEIVAGKLELLLTLTIIASS